MNDGRGMMEFAMWGSLELPNRIFMPPMGTGLAHPDGTVSEAMTAYYEARAAGGAGLIVSESMQVSETYEPPVTGPRMVTDDQASSWRDTVRRVHRAGGRIAASLTPGLGRVLPAAADGGVPYSASGSRLVPDPSRRCRTYSREQIHDLLRHFRDAVGRAVAVGFDAIDIHAHTGYLADQFFSSAWNRRRDEFGGTLENRMRLGVEMIRIVRDEAGESFPLSMRISGTHHYDGGRRLPESQQMALILQDAGLDVMMVDAGSYEALDWAFPPYYLGDGVYLPDAQAFSEVLDIPVAVCGNLTPALAQQALADGITDFVGFGRMLIADAELPNKVAAGRSEEVRPCIRCNQMCLGHAPGTGLQCSVNAQAGHELDRVLIPAESPRRVVVVGAGPAGMEAARVAAERGHRVAVHDRADRLGGVLEPAARPDFKRELRRMMCWWERQLEHLGVEIRLEHEIGPDSPEVHEADAVVLATGAVPIVPDVPGIDSPYVMDVIDLHAGPEPGSRVVVCGGGLSGADAALELARAGHRVTVIEVADSIARDMVVHNRVALLRMLAEAGVTIRTRHAVTAIDADGVHAEGPGGRVHLAADTVVSAFGTRPDAALGDALRGAVEDLHLIGDCMVPAKVGDAVHSGYLVGASL